jgi:hypothetical protein
MYPQARRKNLRTDIAEVQEEKGKSSWPHDITDDTFVRIHPLS